MYIAGKSESDDGGGEDEFGSKKKMKNASKNVKRSKNPMNN
jgi:hypothetical protein